MATYTVTRDLPDGRLATTAQTPDQVLFIVEAMIHRGITVTVHTEGCHHPNLFSDDRGPDATRYCESCGEQIPNRDL